MPFLNKCVIYFEKKYFFKSEVSFEICYLYRPFQTIGTRNVKAGSVNAALLGRKIWQVYVVLYFLKHH